MVWLVVRGVVCWWLQPSEWHVCVGVGWEESRTKRHVPVIIVNKKRPCVGQVCRLRDCFCGRNLLEIACVSMRKRTIKRTLLRDRVEKIGTCFMGRIGNKKTRSCYHPHQKTSCAGQTRSRGSARAAWHVALSRAQRVVGGDAISASTLIGYGWALSMMSARASAWLVCGFGLMLSQRTVMRLSACCLARRIALSRAKYVIGVRLVAWLDDRLKNTVTWVMIWVFDRNREFSMVLMTQIHGYWYGHTMRQVQIWVF